VAYFLNGGVNLWWGFIYIFIPLEIIRSGLSSVWIGYFLFAVAVPLIILEYPFSKLAGKWGFKKIFKLGYLTTAVFCLICFFTGNIYLILGLLTLASIGMAMLEPTTEAYFFDILERNQDLRFYAPYNTTGDFNGFLGKIISSFILLFFPFKSLFLLFAFFMMIYFFISYKIKNVVESRKG
jgi:MFS family permease